MADTPADGVDIPANGFAIDLRGVAEGTKMMTPSEKGGPHCTPWIRTVNVITPAILRGEAELLADRLRGAPGLAVLVYESMAAVKLPERPTHELSVSLGDDWEPGRAFRVSQRVPGGERSWSLDERRLTSFLDVDSRCRLGGGPEE